MAKKITKKQLREKQAVEDKKFKKILRNGALLSLFALILINVFYIHWCDTKYFIRKHTLYGKKIMPEQICEVENSLKYHKSFGVNIDDNTFYICSSKCKHYIVEHYEQFAFTIDAQSGDSICKAEAILGLKKKGSNLIVYFKNEETFEKYYNKKVR